MMQVLVPLYAHSLGFSVLKIGSVVAIPVMLTVVVRFIGGALSDRFGERKVLQGCYLLSAVAAVMLLWADSYASLLASQTIANLGRSVFWIVSQSLVTLLPGARAGKKLGILAACNHVGSLVGVGLGGVLVDRVNYPGAFAILAASSAACVLWGLYLPQVEAKPTGRTIWHIAGGIARFLRYRRVWAGIFASFAGGLPPALAFSLYPVYLARLSYSEEWIGIALSGRAVGNTLIVLIVGSLMTPGRRTGIFAAGTASVGLFLLATGIVEGLWVLALCIALLGAAGGVMDLWYQVRAVELSAASDRSAAMASAGLGWHLALIFAPILFGWAAESKGFPFAFVSGGGVFMAVGAAVLLWSGLKGRLAG
jgi:MFS family permease